MNKKLLPFLLVLISASAFAQPTLTSANSAPALGDTFITIVCDPTSVTPGSPGPSQTWSFSGLVATSTNTGACVNPALAAGHTALAPYATAAFGTCNRAVQDVSTGVTNYYTLSSDNLLSNATYVSDTAFAVYTDPVKQLVFPFTYLNTFTDNYAGIVYYKPAGLPAVTASESGKDTVTADGYGTLILPPIPPSMTPVTYTNVLRVHTTQSFRDSANLFGTPLVQTYALESYTWYLPGYHSALLTIATANSPLYNGTVVSYAQQQVANHEGVAPVSTIGGSFKLYPNPATNELNIDYYVATSDPVTVSIYDLLGREVAKIGNSNAAGGQHVSYNTSGLTKGMYFVTLRSGSESVTRKIAVE